MPSHSRMPGTSRYMLKRTIPGLRRSQAPTRPVVSATMTTPAVSPLIPFERDSGQLGERDRFGLRGGGEPLEQRESSAADQARHHLCQRGAAAQTDVEVRSLRSDGGQVRDGACRGDDLAKPGCRLVPTPTQRPDAQPEGGLAQLEGLVIGRVDPDPHPRFGAAVDLAGELGRSRRGWRPRRCPGSRGPWGSASRRGCGPRRRPGRRPACPAREEDAACSFGSRLASASASAAAGEGDAISSSPRATAYS